MIMNEKEQMGCYAPNYHWVLMKIIVRSTSKGVEVPIFKGISLIEPLTLEEQKMILTLGIRSLTSVYFAKAR